MSIKTFKRKRENPIVRDYDGGAEDEESRFIPIKSESIKQCKTEWEQGNFIGKGKYGQVHEACKHKECNWIIKVSSLNTPAQQKMFERDINITKRLKGTGIAPEFEGAWICENNGFLVMERLSGSADHFVKYEEDRIELLEWVVKEMKRVISELSERRIIHGDIKPDNFLYKAKRLYISDFGTSINYSRELVDKKRDMGWSWSSYGCEAQKEFVVLYNLWQLELWFRWTEKLKRKPIYIVKDNGESFRFFKFPELDEVRSNLDKTCGIKPPPIKMEE